MGFWKRARVTQRVFAGRSGDGPVEVNRLLGQRRPLQLGVGAMELAQLASGRVPQHLKVLADVQTSALVGCPF